MKGILSLMLLIGLTACGSSLPKPLAEAQQLENRAQSQVVKPDQSLEALLKAQKIYQATDRGEERGRIEVAIASHYLRRGQLKPATGWANRVIAATDVSSETQALAMAKRIQIALRQKNPRLAGDWVNRLVRHCAECAKQADMRVLVGVVQLARNQPADALASAQAAQQASPNSRITADAYRLMGESHLALRNPVDAQHAFEAAYQLDYDDAREDRIWLDLQLLSEAYRRQGRAMEASDTLRRARLARAAER